MINVINTTTNEVIKVDLICNYNGVLAARKFNPEPGTKFYSSYPFIVKTDDTIEVEGASKPCRVVTLAEGFELKAGRTKSEKPATSKKSSQKSEPAKPTTEPVSEPVAEQVPQFTAQSTASDNDVNELALLLLKLKNSNIDVDKVREIVREEVAKQEPTKVVHTIKIVDAPEVTLPSQPHPLLDKVLSLVVNDRVTGRFPWLFGPAGSGKSTIARQVAEALNLPFYSVSSLQQKYELEGYTDATGKLVETTFYKAAKEGGIFLFDEASTTSAEVQVAFNNMLANLVYNFPKEGMITAHKDFHIIAADNTTGRGGNKTYSARYSMDASTLDRYIPIEVDYTMEQDMMMAANDSELVTFLRDLRKVINEANLTYTASPRAAKAIKAMQQMDCFTETEAFNLGLCSGWKKQDIRTLNARLDGTTKYHKLFNKIANS